MTKQEYTLSLRRAWVESHFRQYGLSNEEVMAFIPLPSENFEEGFTAGYNADTVHQWRDPKVELPEMQRRVLVCIDNSRLSMRNAVHVAKRVPHDLSNPDDTEWHWTQVGEDSDVIAWMPLPEPQNTK